MAILTRADLRSKSSQPTHNAFLTGRINKVAFAERADMYYHRCKTNRHLAKVCPAPELAPAAYAAYEKHIIRYKPRPCGSRPEKREQNGAPAWGKFSLSQWIIDSGATDHMLPDFESFSKYSPIVPEPAHFGNGATTNAIGTRLCVLRTASRRGTARWLRRCVAILGGAEF